ncbi:pullulanase [Mycobacterium sp. B14F4]|uniref:pullulanase n=1 Tax=Mycobacterium sp. B14F4 TaxID=3153565 RepID=UPI00325C5C51
MDYCLSDGDGSATMWTAPPDVDVDGEGGLDAVGIDFDGDGLVDDAMADLDADGVAEHLVRDHAGADAAYFTDDGTGTWAVTVDRAGQLRWFGLDGVEHSGGPLVDVDGDGQADDRLVDGDGDGLADRALSPGLAFVDADADGRWDTKLTDGDGDGLADAAGEL